MDKSRKGICSDCQKATRLYSTKLCFHCYRLNQRSLFLSKGIDFPKRLGMRPKYWSFEVLEAAWKVPRNG